MHLMLLAAAASAGTPVLHEGDAAEAIATVSRSTGVPAWELSPRAVGDLFPGEGTTVVGNAQPAQCAPGAGATTNAAVRAQVEAAEKRLPRQEWAEMRERLAAAAALLPCLSEPAEASLMGRLFFLEGYALAELGDATGAARSFRRARAAQPELGWDPRLEGVGRPILEGLGSAPGGALVLGPGYKLESSLWVDGRPTAVSNATLPLAPGLHLVQLLQPSVSTWLVEVRADEPLALVKAPEARERALQGAAEPAGRVVLEAAAARALGPDTELWVWTGGALWHVRKDWEATQVLAPLVCEPPPKKKTAHALIGLGAGLTAVGAAAGVYGLLEADAHHDVVEGESNETYEMRNGWYRASLGVGYAGLGVAAAGVASLVGGVILSLPERGYGASMGALPVAGGGVVLVSGGF